ncbi:MAG TPA: histidinol dehydrogenase [Chitinophagaceae bacterium]|nr:histidinol dehydrogenase [Chitinophagaceae bacterium]HPH30304.1 histidinol dehydrogenase [Chitinophagaceae bacterium]HPN57630.1 histidinol dehydrogenase [Chitinophagaceae bacterium]
MRQYNYPSPDQWEELIKRPVTDNSALEKTVRRILRKVKENGDRAVRKFTSEFDGVKLKKLQVSEKEIKTAAALLPDELKAAIRLAKENIERFHQSQREAITVTETMPGIRCWRQSLPIEKTGLYIPGGTAPLFSTVLMLAVPASLAGCKEIILCTPPGKDGAVHPAILFTAALCGVTQVFKAGGVQAIGAMAYGTESIPRVFKLFGPGNQYVTLAKQLVQQDRVAIDMPAGPSEVLVIADASAHPAFVASDLLSQAEHGTDSQVILLTPSAALAGEVEKEVEKQLNQLPRKAIAEKALANSRTILFNNMQEAVAFSNYYAPEHLILSCDDAESIAQQVTAAGSVFIGHYSPESAGDYASGTNHTLPTNGYAAMYSGVSLDSFMKKITFQQLSQEGLQRIGDAIMTMAAAEGLDAHKNAIAIRLNTQHGI